jgi:hypothetical protein
LIGTHYHYGAYQQSTVPFWRDSVPVAGTLLDQIEWDIDLSRDLNHLRQTFAEPSNPSGLWPQGTDHTHSKGRGIAENADVRTELFASFHHALNTTFNP